MPYGWVGWAASIRRWLLLYAADKVQKGGVDDPKDQNAIKIGMDLWDRPSLTPRFCSSHYKDSFTELACNVRMQKVLHKILKTSIY